MAKYRMVRTEFWENAVVLEEMKSIDSFVHINKIFHNIDNEKR
ncbi:hypothetical protein [Neobacillus rhizophilus]|nr:hypothetical protein [Neobacillus rhizophilus]